MSEHNAPPGRRIPPPAPPPIPAPVAPPLNEPSAAGEAPRVERPGWEDALDEPHLSAPWSRADRPARASRPHARARKIGVLFNTVMNIVAPILGLALGWFLLGKMRPELSPQALLSGQPQVALPQPAEPQQVGRSHEPAPSEHASRAQQSQSSDTPYADGRLSQGRPRPADESSAAGPSAAGGPIAAAPISTRLLSDVLAKPHAIDALPTAVDLPPFGDPRTAILAQLDPGAAKPCTLSLISGEIPGREGQRLKLAQQSSEATEQLWSVHVSQPNDVATAAVAEFLWDDGKLMFRWRYATDHELRTSLVNSIVKLAVDEREKSIQLRTPIQAGGLTLDLTQRRLSNLCELHHQPPWDWLKVTVTAVEFQEDLQYVLDEYQQPAGPGRKIPIHITTSPGVKFDAWLGSNAEKPAIYVEGHYRPAGFPPLLFTQQKVETQYRTFSRQRVEAINRLPVLQRALARTEGELRRTEGQVRRARNAAERHAAQTAVNLFRLQRESTIANIARTRVEIPTLAQRIAELQDIGALGNRIHDRSVLQYRVHLPLEHGGSTYDVVLLETVGRSARPTHTFARAFAAESAERFPVPSDAQIAAAAAVLKAEFGERYAEAQDAPAKRELAEALIQQATLSSQDLPRQYELLRSATKILAPLDVAAALDVADQIEQLFDVEHLALRGPILVRAAAASDQRIAVIQAVLELIDDAQSQQDHSAALELLALARSLAEAQSDRQLARQVQQRIETLQDAQQLALQDADGPKTKN